LKIEDDSFFSVAGPGAGVVSLLEGLLSAVAVALGFAFPFPKKSFAVDGWVLGSGLGFAAGAAVGALEAWGTGAGAATAGGGRRVVRRLTFLLIIVPYFVAVSRGSSSAVRSLSSRVASESTWRSWFCQCEFDRRTDVSPSMDEVPDCRCVSRKCVRIGSAHL